MTQKAQVTAFRQFIRTIQVLPSGVFNPHFGPHEIAFESSDDALGDTIKRALEHSFSQATNAEVKQLFSLAMQRSKDWEAATLRKYGLKHKRQLWKCAQAVSVLSEGDKLTLTPTMHMRLDHFRGSNALQDVVIPANSKPAEIGAALRVALSRCTQHYGS